MVSVLSYRPISSYLVAAGEKNANCQKTSQLRLHGRAVDFVLSQSSTVVARPRAATTYCELFRGMCITTALCPSPRRSLSTLLGHRKSAWYAQKVLGNIIHSIMHDGKLWSVFNKIRRSRHLLTFPLSCKSTSGYNGNRITVDEMKVGSKLRRWRSIFSPNTTYHIGLRKSRMLDG